MLTWLVLLLIASLFMVWDLLISAFIAAGIQTLFVACFWRNVTRGLEGLEPKFLNTYLIVSIIGVQLVLAFFGVT